MCLLVVGCILSGVFKCNFVGPDTDDVRQRNSRPLLLLVLLCQFGVLRV